MAGFDDILKKGKKAVASYDPKDIASGYISTILSSLCKLNATFSGRQDRHYVHSIDLINCASCNTAMYLLTVTDANDDTKKMTWYLTSWSINDRDKYLCEKCTLAKKGKK